MLFCKFLTLALLSYQKVTPPHPHTLSFTPSYIFSSRIIWYLPLSIFHFRDEANLSHGIMLQPQCFTVSVLVGMVCISLEVKKLCFWQLFLHVCCVHMACGKLHTEFLIALFHQQLSSCYSSTKTTVKKCQPPLNVLPF